MAGSAWFQPKHQNGAQKGLHWKIWHTYGVMRNFSHSLRPGFLNWNISYKTQTCSHSRLIRIVFFSKPVQLEQNTKNVFYFHKAKRPAQNWKETRAKFLKIKKLELSEDHWSRTKKTLHRQMNIQTSRKRISLLQSALNLSSGSELMVSEVDP